METQQAPIADDLRTQATDALHRADVYVRENPIPTVLGALALGFVIGLLVHTPQPTPKSKWDEFRGRAEDSRDDLKSLLEAIAEKTRKSYKESKGSVRKAIKEAANAASDIDIDDYTDPVANWFQRLWKKVR